MKKAIIFLVSFFLLMIDCQALDIESDYAVLYNLNDESVIFSKNKDVVVSVASLTKIMTVLVAIESIDDYSSEVILQEEIFSGLKGTGAYVIGLRPQQKVTYNDLLYGTFLASGADAAVALGVSVAGSEENFVKLMNNKVEEIWTDYAKMDFEISSSAPDFNDVEDYSSIELLESAIEWPGEVIVTYPYIDKEVQKYVEPAFR